MASVVRAGSPPPRAPSPVGSELLDRQPPSSVEAERAVLARILLDPLVCDDVALALRMEDFYDEGHQRLYRQMLRMHEEGRAIDPTLLVERLIAAGELELIGGPSYLGKLFQGAVTAAHA